MWEKSAAAAGADDGPTNGINGRPIAESRLRVSRHSTRSRVEKFALMFRDREAGRLNFAMREFLVNSKVRVVPRRPGRRQRYVPSSAVPGRS